MPMLSARLFSLAALLPACGPAIATTSGGSEGSTGEVRATDTPTTVEPDATTTSEGSTSEDETGVGAATESSAATTGPRVQLTELRIEPVYAILDSATGGQARDFSAIALTEAGDEVDVTAMVQWSIKGPGEINGGTLTSPESDAPLFDRAVVTATIDGLSAGANAVISVRTQDAYAPQLFNLSSEPLPRQLDFRPVIDKVDVFFLVDTVSYAGEDFLPSFHDRVTNLIVPQLQAEAVSYTHLTLPTIYSV